MGSWFAWIDRWLHDAPAATAGAFATLPDDGRPWRFEPPRRTVAVGDVQGDLVGLDAVLRRTGLCDGDGDWCGGDDHLVLLGDLVGGHDDSRYLVAMVRRLERQARRAGGAVHALLGNHDLLPARGDVSRFTPTERLRYETHARPGAPGPGAADAFRGDSELARWLRSRNALVRIGDALFAHAGLDEWFAATDPGAVNATVRAWLAHWQGRAPAPPDATCWAVGTPDMHRESPLARGPLWTRAFKPQPDRPAFGPSRKQLARWLDASGLRRVVLGHCPVGDRILLEHPYYGDRVVMCDTRLADPTGGRLTALELSADGPNAVRVGDRHRDAACRRREQRLLRLQALAGRSGWRPAAWPSARHRAQRRLARSSR